MSGNEQMSFEDFGYSEEAMAEAWAASVQGMQALEQAAKGKAALDPSTVPIGSELAAGQGSPLSAAAHRPAPPPGERSATAVRSSTRAAVPDHRSEVKDVIPCGGEAGTLANLSGPVWSQQQYGLIQFVERLAQVYLLNRRELPPCWLSHPNLVAEYHALWRFHHSQFTLNESKGAGPYSFHQALHSLRHRLGAELGEPKCEQGEHSQDYFDRISNSNRELRFEHYREYGYKGPIGGWNWPEVTWTYNPDSTEDPHQTGEGQ